MAENRRSNHDIEKEVESAFRLDEKNFNEKIYSQWLRAKPPKAVNHDSSIPSEHLHQVWNATDDQMIDVVALLIFVPDMKHYLEQQQTQAKRHKKIAAAETSDEEPASRTLQHILALQELNAISFRMGTFDDLLAELKKEIKRSSDMRHHPLHAASTAMEVILEGRMEQHKIFREIYGSHHTSQSVRLLLGEVLLTRWRIHRDENLHEDNFWGVLDEADLHNEYFRQWMHIEMAHVANWLYEPSDKSSDQTWTWKPYDNDQERIVKLGYLNESLMHLKRGVWAERADALHRLQALWKSCQQIAECRTAGSTVQPFDIARINLLSNAMLFLMFKISDRSAILIHEDQKAQDEFFDNFHSMLSKLDKWKLQQRTNQEHTSQQHTDHPPPDAVKHVSEIVHSHGYLPYLLLAAVIKIMKSEHKSERDQTDVFRSSHLDDYFLRVLRQVHKDIIYGIEYPSKKSGGAPTVYHALEGMDADVKARYRDELDHRYDTIRSEHSTASRSIQRHESEHQRH